MFVNLDYDKKPQEIKLYLAKPHKQVVSILTEAFAEKLVLKLGEISELEFSLPYYIVDEDIGQNIKNPNIELARERMLVRVDMGGTFGEGGTYKEWFLIDSIEENSSDKEIYNVKCFSLAYELAGKYIGEFETDGLNAKDMLTEFLDQTAWNVGVIDPIFQEMTRSFSSSSDATALECIIDWAETFGGLVQYDTFGKTVSLLDVRKNGMYRGLSLDYGKLINSISKTRTTDELVTRMYVFGEEEISIDKYNPTGQVYLENFDFYIYPFERDSNRNVIKSSYYMTDELCHALLDHKELVDNYSSMISASLTDFNNINKKIRDDKLKLNELELQAKTIEELLDVAKSTEDEALTAQREQELLANKGEISSLKELISQYEGILASMSQSLEAVYNAISYQTNMTPELLAELDAYIITKTWRDENYFDEKELYEDAIKRFEDLRKPKVVFEIDIESFLDVIEYQEYWDKLILGDIIKVKYPQMDIQYEAKIIEIEYDISEKRATLTVANTKDFLNDNEKLMQMIYDNSTATQAIQNNKYKWDKVKDLTSVVDAMMQEEWDATKKRITAGVNNTVEISNRGIILKDPNFPNEMIIQQAGVIALSNDGGLTWKTAIKPDGIVAERIIGKLIAGGALNITNEKGTFKVDGDGIFMNADKLILSSGSQINDYSYWWETYSDKLRAYSSKGKLDGYERKVIWNYFLDLTKSKDTLISMANYSTGANVIIEEYNTAYNDLNNYLLAETNEVAIKPKESDKTQSVNIDTQTIRLKFDTLIEKTNLLRERATQAINYKNIEVRESIVDKSNEKVNEMTNREKYRIDIVKSNGNVLKDNIPSSILTVKVFYSQDGLTETEITSTLPKESFIWYKIKSDGTEDVVWSNSKVGIGNTIEISKYDIIDSETISCEVEIDE